SPAGAEHTWQPFVGASGTAGGTSWVGFRPPRRSPWLDWVASSSQGARCAWLWARPPSQAEGGPLSSSDRQGDGQLVQLHCFVQTQPPVAFTNSPSLTVIEPGPVMLSLAMIEPSSPESSFARSQ